MEKDEIEKKLAKLETKSAVIQQSIKSMSSTLNEVKDKVTENAVIMEKIKNISMCNQKNKDSIDDVYKNGTVKCLSAHKRIDSIQSSINWMEKVGAGIIVMIVTQFFGIIAYAIEHFRR